MKKEWVGGILSVLATWGIMLFKQETLALSIPAISFVVNLILSIAFSSKRTLSNIAIVFLIYCMVTIANIAIITTGIFILFLATFKKFGG